MTLEFYQIIFTDMLNQKVLGGHYTSFLGAVSTARGIVKNGHKSSWEIVRKSDGVVLAQSKAVSR